jgi:hypothetical protein
MLLVGYWRVKGNCVGGNVRLIRPCTLFPTKGIGKPGAQEVAGLSFGRGAWLLGPRSLELQRGRNVFLRQRADTLGLHRGGQPQTWRWRACWLRRLRVRPQMVPEYCDRGGTSAPVWRCSSTPRISQETIRRAQRRAGATRKKMPHPWASVLLQSHGGVDREMPPCGLANGLTSE